jgi:hypothetical protein
MVPPKHRRDRLVAALIVVAMTATASAPVSADPKAVFGRFRVEDAKKSTFFELAPDGTLLTSGYRKGKLGADERLVLEGDARSFRVDDKGAVLFHDQEIARFEDDSSVALTGTMTVHVAKNGSTTLVETTKDAATGAKKVKRVRAGALRVDGDDAHLRKLALFVLASEAYAAMPLGGDFGVPPSKVSTVDPDTLAAVAYAAVGAVVIGSTVVDALRRAQNQK